MAMAHAVRIQSREQFISALDVLDRIGGTWQAVGTSAAPVFLLTNAQYDALIQAGVVTTNGREGKARGNKAEAKKTKP
jgi:cell division GTPase FtsZ